MRACTRIKHKQPLLKHETELDLPPQDTNNEPGNEVLLASAKKLLGDEIEEVVESACTIFRNLTVTLEGVALVAGRDDIVNALTAMLTEPPLKLIPLPVLELVTEILASLTRVYEGARCVAYYPIFIPLLAVLKKPRLYRIETILHCAMIISNAAMHNQGKLEAIREGAVEMCLRVLTKNLNGALASNEVRLIDELTRSLVGAVMGLSTVEEAKPQVVEFGVEPLVKCLLHSNIAIKRNASIAINSACESPGGTVHFTQRLLYETSLIAEVLGVKAISALVKSVSGVDDDDKHAALKAILALLEEYSDGSAAEQVLQTLGLLSTLVDLALQTAGNEHDSPQLQQLAFKILQKLSATSDNHCRRIGKLMRKQGADEKSFSAATGLSVADFEQRFP